MQIQWVNCLVTAAGDTDTVNRFICTAPQDVKSRIVSYWVNSTIKLHVQLDFIVISDCTA